jgi:hypothetical protein
MRFGKPISIPKCLMKYPNVLPIAAPIVKEGINTPAGIGDAIARMVRMNLRMQ